MSEEILTRVGGGGVSRSGGGGGGRASCSGAGLAACEAIVLFDYVASHYDDDGDVTEYRERENVPVVTARPSRASAASHEETDAAAAADNLPVQLVMTLGLDFGMAGSEGSDTREKFKRDVAQDLATASGLAAANFNIKHVSAGSIILDMEVLPDPLAPGAHLLAAKDLANQAADISSKLRSGKLTSHAIGVVVIPSRSCEAAFHDRLTREGGGGMSRSMSPAHHLVNAARPLLPLLEGNSPNQVAGQRAAEREDSSSAQLSASTTDGGLPTAALRRAQPPRITRTAQPCAPAQQTQHAQQVQHVERENTIEANALGAQVLAVLRASFTAAFALLAASLQHFFGAPHVPSAHSGNAARDAGHSSTPKKEKKETQACPS